MLSICLLFIFVLLIPYDIFQYINILSKYDKNKVDKLIKINF